MSSFLAARVKSTEEGITQFSGTSEKNGLLAKVFKVVFDENLWQNSDKNFRHYEPEEG